MRPVPFFANTEDDTHCFQAAFRMVFKYFLPKEDFSWEKLEAMSDKRPGMATWPQRMLINLMGRGFDVKMVEGFDAQAFIQEGGTYLKRAFGVEAATWQSEHSDLVAEQHTYQEALDIGVAIEQRIPELFELANYLDDGYLLVCQVNAKKLNDLDGYIGHEVVVYSIDETTVGLHDPGLPPLPERNVDRQTFIEAWSSPNEASRNFIAVKYQGVA
jgi:hypothetical protein